MRELRPVERMLRLMDLRKKLMAYDFDALDLRHLDPLRREVEYEYELIIKPAVAEAATDTAEERKDGPRWPSEYPPPAFTEASPAVVEEPADE